MKNKKKNHMEQEFKVGDIVRVKFFDEIVPAFESSSYNGSNFRNGDMLAEGNYYNLSKKFIDEVASTYGSMCMIDHVSFYAYGYPEGFHYQYFLRKLDGERVAFPVWTGEMIELFSDEKINIDDDALSSFLDKIGV